MMSSLLNANMVGVPQPQQYLPSGGCTADSILDGFSKDFIASVRRASRGANTQRANNSMRISKPGSANNSPRSATMQSRRRTLIGDGFQQARYQPHTQPTAEMGYLPTPVSESSSSDCFFERDVKPARPVSWHPSPTNTQLFQQQQSTLSFPAYHEAEALLSLQTQQLAPTPTIYSGYTSPTSAFSPLALPYSSFSPQQPLYSSLIPPRQQQQPHQQQQQAPPFLPDPSASYATGTTVGTVSQIPYLPVPRISSTASWGSYQLPRSAAPPTPEDICVQPPLPITAKTVSYGPTASEARRAAPVQVPAAMLQPVYTSGVSTTVAVAAEPSADSNPGLCEDEEDDSDSDEGEILYGMGLYDVPSDTNTVENLHRSTVFSLLGGRRNYTEDVDRVDNGNGLGLKLEDAWEPPAVDDDEDDDEEQEGEEEEDGENE